LLPREECASAQGKKIATAVAGKRPGRDRILGLIHRQGPLVAQHHSYKGESIQSGTFMRGCALSIRARQSTVVFVIMSRPPR